MKKLFLIFGGLLVFVVSTGFIALEITKQQVKSRTQENVERVTREIIEKEEGNLTQEEIDSRIQEEIKKEIEGRTKQIVGQIFEGGSKSLQNRHKVKWAGHEFEVAYLDTSQYVTTGNKSITFTNNGWYAPSYSMPRSMLLDANLNKKSKVRITADFEGEMKSTNEDCTEYCITTEQYHFSEFAIYIVDESGNKQGTRVLGTRHNIVQGNKRDKYKFTELTVENTGDEIVVMDSTGYRISYSKDFKYITTEAGRELNRGADYGQVHQDQKWRLGINCHVNGEGYCRLTIKEIQIVE